MLSRENHDAGLPLGLIYCMNKNMVRDRVTALRETTMFEPRALRHFISGVRVTEVDGDRIVAQANFAVMESLSDREPTLNMVGRYLDELRVTPQGWRSAAATASTTTTACAPRSSSPSESAARKSVMTCPDAATRQSARRGPVHIERRWPGRLYAHPQLVYTDPAIFQKEMDVFFGGKTWNYVGLECEVPETGCFKRNWIGNRPVIMVRGENGDIHVLENRCAHRGAQICWQNTGKVADFTCPYHQWNYDLEGNLQGVPFRRGALGKGGMPRDFDPKQNGIRKLRSVNRGGSVWATFAEDAPSFEDYCGPEVLAEIDHMLPGKPLKLLGYSRQLIPSNWKMYLENLKDPYHATLLHTFYITFGLWRADSKSECIPTGGGAQRDGVAQRRQEEDRGHHRDEPLPRGPGAAGPGDGHAARRVQSRTRRRRLGVPGGAVRHPGQFAQDAPRHSAQPHRARAGVHLLRLRGRRRGNDAPAPEARQPAGAGRLRVHGRQRMLNQVQIGVTGYPEARGIVEMGGRDTEPADYMVTEVLIRSFYDYYRKAMGL